MTYHPTGVVIDIVGTNMSDRGRHCEEHDCCGREVMQEDVVVRLRKCQISFGGREETAIEAVWVTDGIDRCRVGFLQRHMIPRAAVYDGALAQVTAVYSESNEWSKEQRKKFYKNKGCCVATIISMHGSAEGDALPDDDDATDEEEEGDNAAVAANAEQEEHDNANIAANAEPEEEERLETQQFTPKKRALNDE